MRKAAGVLMIVLGIATMGIFLYGVQPYYSAELKLLVILTTVFVITGGVFCLKRKYWVICVISSVVLCCFSTMLSYVFFPYGLGLYLVVPGGFISLIFVCLRKREWQES